MFAIFKNECKMGFLSFVIWSLGVGIFGFFCILLYKSMESTMGDLAASFGELGTFSEMFGMNELSMATAKGYFAAEVGTIHSLGSAMFAAVISTVILSKEEDAHTAEYTFTLPVSRGKAVAAKFASVILRIFVFTVICFLFYIAGFKAISEKDVVGDLVKYMFLQFMMNIEVASVCFLISAISRRIRLGIGISVALVMYMFDLISKVVPKLSDAKILSPFYYSGATNVFTGKPVETISYIIASAVIILLTAWAGVYYCKRDLV